MLKQSKGNNDNIKVIYDYAKKALKGNPNDAKIKELHDEVKVSYDKYMEENKPLDQDKEEKKQESIDKEEPDQNYAYVPSNNSTTT